MDVESTTVVVAPTLAYRAVQLDRFALDALAGVRIWIVETELEFEPGLAPRVEVDDTRSWADPIVGLRVGVSLTDRITVTALADVGGFGAGSDLTWQAVATVGYRFHHNWTVRAGYRALGVDFSRDGFELDTVLHGPVIGFTYRF